MNEVKREKADFVVMRLCPLVQAMNKDIDYCFYTTKGGEEFVHIEYTDGTERLVNVAGDSLKAIVSDVMQYV